MKTLTKEDMARVAELCRDPDWDDCDKGEAYLLLRKLRGIVLKARKFSLAWQEWEATNDQMPDPDTIDSACELSEALGIDPFEKQEVFRARKDGGR